MSEQEKKADEEKLTEEKRAANTKFILFCIAFAGVICTFAFGSFALVIAVKADRDKAKYKQQIAQFEQQLAKCKKHAKAEGRVHWTTALQLGVCKQNKLYAQKHLKKCVKIISAAHIKPPANFEEAKQAVVVLRKENKRLQARVSNSVLIPKGKPKLRSYVEGVITRWPMISYGGRR